MEGITTRVPPGEGLAHPAAATNGTASTCSSIPFYHADAENATELSPAQAARLHEIYLFVLSWPVAGAP